MEMVDLLMGNWNLRLHSMVVIIDETDCRLITTSSILSMLGSLLHLSKRQKR